MQSPVVSVIMSTCKRPPEMVRRAIYSVLNQTFTNIELIIVDDSPDNYKQRKDIASMIKNIADNRIRYIQHKVNKGACVARNTGIKQSNGEYIMYFDDDDELLPNKIKCSLMKFKTRDIGLVYSGNYIIDEQGNQQIIKNKMFSGYVFDELIKGNFVVAFPLVRKECFTKCGLFDANMQSMQDYELWLRIAREYKFEHVDKPLSKVYRHKGDRISTNSEKKVQGAEAICEKYCTYLQRNPSAMNIRLMKLAIFYAINGEKKKAKRAWFSALKAAPFKLYCNLRNSYSITKRLLH